MNPANPEFAEGLRRAAEARVTLLEHHRAYAKAVFSALAHHEQSIAYEVAALRLCEAGGGPQLKPCVLAANKAVAAARHASAIAVVAENAAAYTKIQADALLRAAVALRDRPPPRPHALPAMPLAPLAPPSPTRSPRPRSRPRHAPPPGSPSSASSESCAL